jgi:hypothetical protein
MSDIHRQAVRFSEDLKPRVQATLARCTFRP